MGAYLDTPIKEKNPQSEKNEHCAWGACSMQGWRCGMEDAHIATEIDLPKGEGKAMLFGVFDGHGGKEVAAFAEKHFKDILIQEPNFKKAKYDAALTEAFHICDSKVQKEDYAIDTGTTACVILITPQNIICANAGDSRGVLMRLDKAVELSHDHKPQNEQETKRINAAQHHVEDDRVDGNLALSRAFGDFQYKDRQNLHANQQAVTCNPDVKIVKRTKKDQYIMLACDGIWDCVSNQECIDRCARFMTELKVDDKNVAPVVEKLFDEILAPNTDEGIGTDNMTAIWIKLYNDTVTEN